MWNTPLFLAVMGAYSKACMMSGLFHPSSKKIFYKNFIHWRAQVTFLYFWVSGTRQFVNWKQPWNNTIFYLELLILNPCLLACLLFLFRIYAVSPGIFSHSMGSELRCYSCFRTIPDTHRNITLHLGLFRLSTA